MDVKLLEYLLTIESCQSISAAAEQIHISQSALSQNLARIEQELCTPLFYRQGKRLVPTPAGEVYLKGARQMIQAKEDTYERLNTLAWLNQHSIRIAVCSQVYQTSGPQILSAMHQQFGNLHLDFIAADSSVIGQYLLNDAADAAIFCTEAPSHLPLPHHLLFKESLVLAVPNDMNWPTSEASLDTLQNQPFIYPALQTFLHHLVHRAIRQKRIIFSDVYRANTIADITLLTEHGYGAALLPSRLAGSLSRCHIYPWEPEISYRVIFAAAPKHKDSPLFQEFFHTLSQCLQQPQDLSAN